jgi:hypothetical protein
MLYKLKSTLLIAYYYKLIIDPYISVIIVVKSD